MQQTGYHITAELRVKDKRRLSEAKAALVTLCQNTVGESGCSLFSLHQCLDDECRFLLWERFENEAAFNQHFREQYTIDFVTLDLTEIVQYFRSDVVIK